MSRDDNYDDLRGSRPDVGLLDRPVVEINLMGYADPKQVGSGLRQRLYSRAFIVGDPDPEKTTSRFVYLVLDTQSGDTAVRYGILDALRDLGPEYAALYGHHNVAVTGTHSHSGPGGWLNYLLPQITSKGFDHQGFRAIVDGATLSIKRAHESLQPGHLSVASAKVKDGNINRSLFAYMANPEEERQRYNRTDKGDDGSVEKDLTLVRFQRVSDKKDIGVLTWFPTHGTSMLGNNTLITGDNKGEEYAVQRYEGASTLYGPHTLAAYMNVTLENLQYLAKEAPLPPQEVSFPPDNSNRSLSFIVGVVRDAPPLFKKFGDIIHDVQDYYEKGAWVTATFVGANPRNNLRLEETYASVDKLCQGNWVTIRDDRDWSLVYRWRRINTLLATSEVDITWETEDWAEPGTYRLHYYGDAKALGGTITSFEAISSTFVLG
ncbi:MAG: hypothetical protein STHCBS139747_004460 [Sporothrix thermara]